MNTKWYFLIFIILYTGVSFSQSNSQNSESHSKKDNRVIPTTLKSPASLSSNPKSTKTVSSVKKVDEVQIEEGTRNENTSTSNRNKVVESASKNQNEKVKILKKTESNIVSLFIPNNNPNLEKEHAIDLSNRIKENFDFIKDIRFSEKENYFIINIIENDFISAEGEIYKLINQFSIQDYNIID